MLDKKKPVILIQMTSIDTVGELQQLQLNSSMKHLPPNNGSLNGHSRIDVNKRPDIPTTKMGLSSDRVQQYWKAVQSKSQCQLPSTENMGNRFAGMLSPRNVTSDIVWSIGPDDDAQDMEIKAWTQKLDQYILRKFTERQAQSEERLQLVQKPRNTENQKRGKSSYFHKMDKQTLIFSLACESNMRHCATHHVLRFDSVGSRGSKEVQSELARMSDELILVGRHICHVRITPHHQPNAQYMRRLLVTEVETRVNSLRGKLLQIRMRYTDISKHSPMLPNYFSEANKSQKEDGPAALVFKTSLGLVRWLQTNYGKRWAKADTHDCFDMQYVFDDAKGRIRTICFSVLDFHLSKMNSYEKDELRNFFQNINGRKRAAKATVLNESLRQFFDDTRKWQMWLMFDVPLILGVGVLESDEILSFANAAYVAFNSGASMQQSVVENKSKSSMKLPEKKKSGSVKYSGDVISVGSEIWKENKIEFLSGELKGQINQEIVPMRGEVIKVQKFEAIMAAPHVRNLSWKETIDTKISEVLNAMEASIRKWKLQFDNTCNNLRQLISPKEHFKAFERNDKKLYQEFNYDAALRDLYNTSVAIEASVPPQEVTDYLMKKIKMLQQRYMQNKTERHEAIQKKLWDMLDYNKLFIQDNESIDNDAFATSESSKLQRMSSVVDGDSLY